MRDRPIVTLNGRVHSAHRTAKARPILVQRAPGSKTKIVKSAILLHTRRHDSYTAAAHTGDASGNDAGEGGR
jgi:hypothetical protein